MNFVVIFGPPAVGKMTVGYELAKLTGMPVFHNHMTIDLVLEFFPYGHDRFHTLVSEFRQRIFEEVAAEKGAGMIFTYVWALDQEDDKLQLDSYCEIFKKQGCNVFFVELEAALEERLERNKGKFRLQKKSSKRDIARSEANLLDTEKIYTMNSKDDFFYKENYVKINNTDISPEETARQIADAFGFTITQSE
ncbi:MAG TPA: AAA family ATPase [Anaerolineales bacterium]|nr:AAA family ATPase [Anaerolineales bacterium]